MFDPFSTPWFLGPVVGGIIHDKKLISIFIERELRMFTYLNLSPSQLVQE
jgi:hypothetical protein